MCRWTSVENYIFYSMRLSAVKGDGGTESVRSHCVMLTLSSLILGHRQFCPLDNFSRPVERNRHSLNSRVWAFYKYLRYEERPSQNRPNRLSNCRCWPLTNRPITLYDNNNHKLNLKISLVAMCWLDLRSLFQLTMILCTLNISINLS